MVKSEDVAFLDPTAPKHVTLDDAAQQGRVMIVGDIHGCADEFRELLERYGAAGDTLILAGDLVNKGPKSIEVLDIARARGALGVAGNHEIASLRGRARAEPKYAWTAALTEEHLTYLRRLPYTISLPAHAAVVVHAGLVPGVPLAGQDARTMMTMRNLLPCCPVAPAADGAPRFEAQEKNGLGGSAWAAQWIGPPHVYFGHDAMRKLQRHAHATGLDTGCVYGGELTAAILERGRAPRLVSVDAHREHVASNPRVPHPERGGDAPRGAPSPTTRSEVALGRGSSFFAGAALRSPIWVSITAACASLVWFVLARHPRSGVSRR